MLRSVRHSSFGTTVRRLPMLLGVATVRAFQGLVRPFLVGTCKFHPSCSDYAVEALTAHGAVRGGALAVRRVCRCHPFTPGGVDPVPPR